MMRPYDAPKGMHMKLKKLFKDIDKIQIKGSKELEVSGICSNSKLVAPGNLFIAKKGFVDDGARYIAEAIAGGAAAVLTDMYDPSIKNVTQVIFPSVAEIEGLLAAQYYQSPSDELFMVGITGTNGKTTTTFLTKYLLDHLDGPSGLIGTIEYIIGKQRYQATRTTPDVVSNHKMLREMCLQGCRSALMEVTSHALDQGRVRNVHFDVAVFTNLTLDHLDYHGTMEVYANTKSLLFRSLGKDHAEKRKKFPPVAICNADSPWLERILEENDAKVMTYGIENKADLNASDISLTPAGTRFTIHYKGQKKECVTPLVGRFNVYNCLAATGVVLAKGYSLDKIIPLLASFPPVPGRLEPVANSLGLKIYVDFAHSDDALQNVLECLSELKTGKIYTVFGCGGDRDQTKRPKMAQVAEMFSDLCIVTSDNPRSEDPEKICAAIVEGFKNPSSYIVEVDRKKAIEKAIELATPQDIILLAGKGHETYQIFDHKTIEFDDRKMAAQICKEKSLHAVAS